MDIGALIVKFRREAKLTIDELSRKSGVPKGTINKIIAGDTRSPSLDTIRAIAYACGRRLGDFDDDNPSLDAAFSPAARALAASYDALDAHGRAMLRAVAEEEEGRMEEERRALELEEERECRVINLFCEPSAAGLAAGETGQTAVPYTLTPDDPQGAAYAVRLSGDSMEPWFPDGGIVFVNHDLMRSGDIGIFSVGGATVCKQWHYDETLGITYLFSLNRARADADVVVLPNSGVNLVWQGRVMTRRRFDLPRE